MAVIVEKYALDLQEDLTTPTSTRKYPMGLEVVVNDTDVFARKRFKYVKAAHSALTAFLPYQIALGYTTGAECATRAALKCTNSLVGVPSVAFTSNYYGFLQIEGKCYAVGTSGFSAGDKLQLGNGLAALSLCTTGVDYAESQACAVCLVSTTVAKQYVNLGGYRVTCT
jgi:hypothetical protein